MSSFDCGKDGRGGCGASSSCKCCNDNEAGSSSLCLSMEEWHKEQARMHGMLSRSFDRRAWNNFDCLKRISSPALKRLLAEELAWFEAKEVVTPEDEVVGRVMSLKEEYDLVFLLFNSLVEYHLHIRKPGDDDDDE
ncbi:hypothetical protein D1007_35249 [Hordeum vulgare]|nr:hypothetical protein D1007_35249 [Hordeum vulgare]